MTTLTNKMDQKFPSCNMCDNYIFGDKFITVEESFGKIKLCSKLCFDKYSIMVQQRAMKSRKIKKEENKKV